MQKRVWFSLLFLILLSSCDKKLPVLENIDLLAWKEDKNGCMNVRSQSIEKLKEQKEKLKALTQMQVVKLLGRPDQNELYKRNQKFFYYLLEPGVVCGVDKKPSRLTVRFNAVGLSKEVIIEE